MGQEKTGRVNDEVIRAMGAFGGGIASTGRVCGILIGGIATVSALYSRSKLEEKEDRRMWSASYKLTKIFEDLTSEYGGIECRHIARVDWKDREQVRNFYKGENSRRQICTALVGEFAYRLGQLLEKEMEKEK